MNCPAPRLAAAIALFFVALGPSAAEVRAAGAAHAGADAPVASAAKTRVVIYRLKVDAQDAAAAALAASIDDALLMHLGRAGGQWSRGLGRGRALRDAQSRAR